MTNVKDELFAEGSEVILKRLEAVGDVVGEALGEELNVLSNIVSPKKLQLRSRSDALHAL